MCCPRFWRWRCMRQGTFWQQSCAACRSNRSRSAHSAFTWQGRRQASAIFVAPSCRLRGRLQIYLSFLLLLPLPRAYPAVQLTLFAFHVLPAVPLGGGTALYCLLRGTFSEKTAERTITVSCRPLALTLGTLGFSVLRFYGLQLYAFVFGGLHLILLNSGKQRGNMC